ncbi:hypothetical protein OsI_01181 [Oryza sativa Indica Group]|uniref:Uncharacterized protein n=1 Tax=Oryza sativa subsp. indica TaxID=39946 RepID=B8ABR8_ORYSI|nr:hypothetical protein OsI_01181 [Oryza sativa Indica Group]
MGVRWRRGWLQLLHYAESPMRTRGVLGDFQLGGFPHRIVSCGPTVPVAALLDWCLSHIASCFGGREGGIFASLSYFSLRLRAPIGVSPTHRIFFWGREGGIFAFVIYCSLRNDKEPSRFVRICPRKRPHVVHLL